MSVQTIDTDAVKQSIDLRDYAGSYTTLRRESALELAGPCPKCGGDDRFHCQADWFICRQCHPKRGDAIEFILWLKGCAFKDAVAILTNAPLPAPAATRRAPARKAQATQPEAWQRSAAAAVVAAHRRLLDHHDQAAEAGRRYLDRRGLEPHTWEAFKLGYAPSVAIPGTAGKQRAPAIVMPWYKRGVVCAVRYRFLEMQGDYKQTALSGSSFGGGLYGGQTIGENIPSLSTLIICEGELNACSIWQASQATHLDVLSLGSESATITPAMVEQVTKYATTLCWLDREERAHAVMAALPGSYGIKSPTGQDANDLLQAGRLGGFLALHRFQAAGDATKQRRLLYDLIDAQTTDASTRNAIDHIGRTLGITT